ncbi:hypothetical protein AgCh_022957 [Apium graveolens]
MERRNRTMVEMVRSFLMQMKMTANFWGEAVRHTIYILNRLPTRALSGMTLYEAWKNEKPNIGHVKVFGCKAYMKIPNNSTRKLDNRSKSVVNLSKEPGTKAYRMYDPATNKVLISRDVEEELLLMGNYNEAMQEKCWRQAMKVEMNAIERNGMWILTDLPKGHKVIGLKWIFKVKRDADGNILKHKARLIAKGFA